MISSSDSSWTKRDKASVLEYVEPVLHRFLFREALPNLEVPLKNLTGLTDEELNHLKTVHFLLSDEVAKLLIELPKILRNLSHSTHKELVESRGIIRGRVDWNMTFKERYSQGFNDPSLFICQPSTKIYDLPENQLLNFILWKIRSLSEKIDLKISEELLDAKEWNNWQDNIVTRYLKVKKISKNVYFQQISLPRSIKPKTIQKAYRHRNQSYDKVAACYELYEKLFIINDQKVLRELIEIQTLKPFNDDKLFEIYVLIKLLDFLDNHSGELRLGLLKPDLDYTAKYISEKMNICIFYQKTPSDLKNSSKYKSIFNFYDLKVRVRSPDIILRIQTNENEYYQIIEVKRTKKKSYIVDSVYKVLGYINDFQESLESTPNPKGVLVVWDGVKINDFNKALKESVLILKDKNMERGFKKIIGLNTINV
jgi:hypothetical protein